MTYVIVAIFLVGVFYPRWKKVREMHKLISEAEELANQGAELLKKHGSTRGELQRAGVYGKLMELQKKSGKLYREAVPYATYLCWGRFVARLKKPLMLWAYDKVGYFKGTMGSTDAWEDVCRGYAVDTDYYFPQHMLGLLASLRTATILF